MRIFLAGGTGAVGRQLVPLLVRGRHEVVATARTAERAEAVRALGAQPAVMDGLDRASVLRAVAAARPEVVVHQMTALAEARSFRRPDDVMAGSNRLRTEGTDHLLEAARAAGARRFVAQSFTGWPNAREGGRIKTEEDPLDASPAPSTVQTLEAIRRLEHTVQSATDLVGVVLRYGAFYGPGTALAPGGVMLEMVRQRKLPIVGGGAGVWSFSHVADVAEATRLAIEGGPAGIYNIVDDDPAEASVWLPELARILAAPPPRRVPLWLGRLLAGEAMVRMMTEQRGSSNAKAKRLLGWQPAYASWREGFRRGLAAADAA
ncbi:MAG TPA: NAD(P)-dependent oxidoreductase [Vicinamibacteria bacterium]